MLKAIYKKLIKCFKAPEPVPEITGVEDENEVIDVAYEVIEGEYDQDENDIEMSVNTLLQQLDECPNGRINVSWNLYDPGLDEKTDVEFEAYQIDSITWTRFKALASNIRGNSEGWEFDFNTFDTVAELEENVCMPDGSCEEVSSTTTVTGNCIDDNCDTWGTSYNKKAERLYAFYITDTARYGVVEAKYWCL